MSEQGIIINKTQSAITITATSLAFGLITKLGLKKSTGLAIVIAVIGLAAGFVIDTQIQK